MFVKERGSKYAAAAAAFLLANLHFSELPAQGYTRHMHDAGPTIHENTQSEETGAGFNSFAGDAEVEELLRKAMQLTAKGEHEEAHSLYRQLSKQNPDRGVPALGRFLRLTGREEERAEFASEMQSADANLSTLTRARGLTAAGYHEEATSLLEASPEVVDGSQPAATILLARVYAMRGRSDMRENILYNALVNAPSAEAKAFLFSDLISNDRIMLSDSPTSMAMVMNMGVASAHPTRTLLTEKIDPIILNFQSRPGYFQRRERLIEQEGETGVGAAWFTTRLLVREERFEEALAYLDSVEKQYREDPDWAVLAEEKAQLYRNLGRNEDARNYLEILTKREKNARPSVIKDAARAAIATKHFDEAIAHLDRIDINTLNADDRRMLWNLYLVAAVRNRDFDLLLETYPKATERAVSLDFADYDKTIFSWILDTEDHWKIEDMVRAQFAKDPSTPANLWRLAAGAANEARRKSNVIEALYQWSKARPGDLEPLLELTDTALPIARDLSKAEPGVLSVPQQEVDNINAITEAGLIELAKAQPLDPSAYAKLITLYDAWGISDVGAKLEAINCDGAADPRIIAVTAFALAINGHPQHALQLYERALEMDPRNMEITINRAACLTRLNRWDEALEVYQTTWEQGFNGRPFHVHEMLDRVWQIYEHLDREDEAIAYFDEAIKRIPAIWREESLRDVANLLANKNYIDEARPYFEHLIAETENPQIKRGAYESLANVYFKTGDYEQTEKWLDAAAEDFRNDEETYVDFKHSKAEALLKSGKQEETIRMLQEIAKEHDRYQPALLGLFRAAQIAEEMNRKEEARALYEEFLRSESNDFTRRRETEEKLKQM